MIPKQRNHPNIVNKLIGKSSLKSKNRLMKISPNLHTNLVVLLQQKHPARPVFCSRKIAQHALFFPPEKRTCAANFLLQEETPTAASVSAQKKNCSGQKKTLPRLLFCFTIKHIALMGLREKKEIGPPKHFGLDPLYNLPLQPNIRGDYTLTSQLESMPADPAQSFSFSLVTTFVIISEGLKSV